MFSKANCLWTILITIFLHIPHSFSGEVYRWTDEKGTIHFTDDVSKIPKPYSDQAERIEVQEETLKEVEKIGEPEERPDRVNPVRNSSGALNPAGIVLKSDPTAEQRGIISNGVKDYLENIEKKIEMKKSMEKKISELEEELKLSEESLKRIEEYEREDYFYYQPFKDPRTGKWVPVASPYYEEKRRLKAKIDAIQVEIKRIQEKISQLMRSL
jgi:DNA repair exonuclease SbcCD ATPase subunit